MGFPESIVLVALDVDLLGRLMAGAATVLASAEVPHQKHRTGALFLSFRRYESRSST
jgi:hypothetical protein